MESPIGDGSGVGRRKRRRIREKSCGEAHAQAAQVGNHPADIWAGCIAGKENTPGPHAAAINLGVGSLTTHERQRVATLTTGAFSLPDLQTLPGGIVVTSLS